MIETITTLRAEAISVEFDGLKALQDVTFEAAEGEIVGLIGPNGAGKTTLVNVISGFQRPTGGRVLLGERDVTRADASSFARRGLARSFQGGRLFADLTVRENIEVAAVGAGRRRREARAVADRLLRRIGLTTLADRPADVLPTGDQRRLGVVRALAARPRFLLLDEPAAGLNDEESEGLAGTIRAIRDEDGCAIVLIEHDMRVIMRLCDRLHVLNHGRTICIGTPAEVRRDDAVVAAYLGMSG